MGAASDRRAGVGGTPRISAVLGAILFAGACLTACTETPESAAPTGTQLAEPSVPLASPTATEAPFLVPAFDGPSRSP